MKITVLGAGGQLGRDWIGFLDASGTTATGYSSGELDITDEQALDGMLQSEKPNTVINCAAYTDVDRAEKNRPEAERVNAQAVQSLAGLCAKRDVKLVHFSTDYVFPGKKEDRIRFPKGYPEGHDPSPVNWYGETKMRGERGIRESGVSHLIIRTSWLCTRYGSNFVKTMLRLAEVEKQIDVVNDQWGSPSFGENVVYNTFNLLQKRKSGTYNITSDGLITWFELAREIFDITGKKVTVNPVPSEKFKSTATRPFFSKLSIEKLRNVEDAEIWKWQDGLKRLLKRL